LIELTFNLFTFVNYLYNRIISDNLGKGRRDEAQ
jgi:hypothetical protein